MESESVPFLDIQDNEGNTALHLGAKNGHFDVVKYLVEAGADLFIKNNDHWTAESLARQNGHEKVAAYLSYQAQEKENY